MPNEYTLIKQQIEYYRARAAEYDEWFFRTGRYYRGEENKKQWFDEIAVVRAALESSKPRGSILELACGTGVWTPHLVSHAREVIAVDASPEALDVNRRRVADNRVRYECADLFTWQPSERFNYIFFGFWLSHMPRSRFDGFWHMVSDALDTDGRVFFVDSLRVQEATAQDHAPLGRSGREVRKLNDGREFQIVKVFHNPSQLAASLKGRGWTGYVQATDHFFLYGCVSRE